MSPRLTAACDRLGWSKSCELPREFAGIGAKDLALVPNSQVELKRFTRSLEFRQLIHGLRHNFMVRRLLNRRIAVIKHH